MSPSEFPALVQKLRTQCKRPRELVLINEIEKLKEEIADMEYENNKQVIELNSKNSEIFALTAEKSRQTNSFKAHEIQQGRNEDSIKQLNATIGEMKIQLDLQAKVFASIHEEIANFKQSLKPHDGNMNAAIEVSFKTSEH